jgi:hypothetical protein
MPVRDLKYYALIHGRHVRKDRMLKIRSKCLQNVMVTFYNNLARTDSFSVFPAVVGSESLKNQFWTDCAVFKVTGKLSTRKRKFDKKTEKAIRAEFSRLHKSGRSRWFKGKTDDQARILSAANRIEFMCRHELGAHHSIEALFYAVVVESWMTFETFVADLFYEALNNGLPEWRINVGRKYKEFIGGSNWEPQKIAPRVVHDPQEAYGSFLKESDAISFQKFRSIKFWYKTAFGKGIEKFFRETESGYIRALSAVRNVILHKAGIADATYKNEVEKFPELNSVEENKLICLDGEIVRKLRNAAIAVGIELLLYIDGLITPAETKTN